MTISPKKGYAVAKDYGDVIEAPTYRAAMDIGRDVLNAFSSGEVGEIWMAYTVFKNTITHIPKMIRLLPVAVPEEETAEEKKDGPLLLMNLSRNRKKYWMQSFRSISIVLFTVV